MKQQLARIIVTAAACVMAIGLVGCSKSPQETNAPEATPSITESDSSKRVVRVVETGSGVTVSTAADWATTHPDIHASYMKNANNDEYDDYVEKYPMIAVLYEGMGFSEFYNSARGHLYSIEDVNATGRPHPLANCFACKTPNFTAAVIELGDEAYKIPFNEMSSQVVEAISCYNCHANEPGELIVTHTYLADALGSDLQSVDPANLACGQCHVEYHFDPDTKAVTLPYSDLNTMNPDSILEYYNNLHTDDQVFADYVNPRSGVRQIKVQHPEFETYLGTGSVHSKTFNCADCHMGEAVNESGVSYTNHEWVSPLDNAKLLEDSCVGCHTNLSDEVSTIQSSVQGRTKEIGYALEELMEDLVLAAEGTEYTNEELGAIFSVYRDAQFYWDFVFVENSNGAHNSKLTHQCLDKAETLLNETRSMLK